VLGRKSVRQGHKKSSTAQQNHEGGFPFFVFFDLLLFFCTIGIAFTTFDACRRGAEADLSASNDVNASVVFYSLLLLLEFPKVEMGDGLMR
jgi:hypothetical protein